MLPSYIKDTKDFLQKLQRIGPLPSQALLFTMDVVGLYNNIPHKDGLDACRLMLNRRTDKHPPTEDIVRLAKLVLELNSFKYEEKHYLQVCGTAMGTRMAPSYANLFMGTLEERMLSSAPNDLTPHLYFRFIDDVFGIWLHGEAALKQFFEHANSCHPDISFTFEYGVSVNFLDTLATISDGRITTDLYTKPTDTHQYLLPSSNHPPHVHHNLPYGLAIRLRTIVSEDVQFEVRLTELERFLQGRGYAKSLIRSQFNRVRALPREEVINRGSKLCKQSERIPLVVTWNPCLPDLQQLLEDTLPILQSTPQLRANFPSPALVSYKRAPNLRDLLIHTRPKKPFITTGPTSSGTYPCNSSRCKTCASISNKSIITDSINGRFTCRSESVIYLLSCTSCPALYVGEQAALYETESLVTGATSTRTRTLLLPCTSANIHNTDFASL